MVRENGHRRAAGGGKRRGGIPLFAPFRKQNGKTSDNFREQEEQRAQPSTHCPGDVGALPYASSCGTTPGNGEPCVGFDLRQRPALPGGPQPCAADGTMSILPLGWSSARTRSSRKAGHALFTVRLVTAHASRPSARTGGKPPAIPPGCGTNWDVPARRARIVSLLPPDEPETVTKRGLTKNFSKSNCFER